MNRVLGAAGMPPSHPLFSLGAPWAIVASSCAITIGIWELGHIVDQAPGDGSTGGVAPCTSR